MSFAMPTRVGVVAERDPKVMVVYGTRPEAIKMAPLVLALGAHPRLQPVVVVTGQHREMLDQSNAMFGITPDHDLDLMVQGASVAEISSRVMLRTGELIREVRPDVVVVQGDTTSAFSAALAAFYEQVPVVHLEAGLRTGDLASPFPEEGNRNLIGRLAALHLAPTPTSRDNLLKEGVDPASVLVTGNTVIDALHMAITVPPRFSDPRVPAFLEQDGPLILVTCHRRESWGVPMQNAMQALRRALDKHPEARILLPMHRNPVVREIVEPVFAGLDNVLLTEPLDYHEFTHAMRSAHLVVTDSGGVQEEAPSLGRPVLVMRESTERPEAIDAGTVRLVGTGEERVLEGVLTLLEDHAVYDAMANATNPYGDGFAAERSVAAIAELLSMGERLPDFDESQPVRWRPQQVARAS